MSIIFADDFKGYGANAALMLNGLFAEVNGRLDADPDPNATGRVFHQYSPSNPQTNLRRVLPISYSTVGVAYRFWLPALPGYDGQSPRVGFSNAANALQFSVGVGSNGRFIVYNSGGGAIAYSDIALTANAWHHIEMKATGNDVNGSLEIRVDGISVFLNAALAIGAAASYNQFRFDFPGQATNFDYYIKDLVVWVSTGTHNTDFLGTVSVIGMTTNSDVSLGWTPSTGTTGWNLLDDSPPNDGVDYITAPFPVPPASVFELSPLPLNVSSVRALITQVRARKQDGGDGNIQSGLISAGTEGDGSNRPITTAFTYYEDVFEADPHTGATWTPGAADVAQFKINRTV
jgi:hypothetical protein